MIVQGGSLLKKPKTVTFCNVCGEDHDPKLTCLQAWLQIQLEEERIAEHGTFERINYGKTKENN